MNSNFCKGCGQALDTNSRFCAGCGSAVAGQQNSTAPNGARLVELPATPPSFNWIWVLVLTIVTAGSFGIIWAFVQWSYVRKADPAEGSRLTGWICASTFLVIGSYLFVVGFFLPIWTLLFGGWGYHMIPFIEKSYRKKGYAVRLDKTLTVMGSFIYIQHHLMQLASLKPAEAHRLTCDPEPVV